MLNVEDNYASKIVPGIGPLESRVVIVGEAPGKEEEVQGRPFVGSSGRLFNDILASVGIARNECYITNVVKTRPSGNNFEEFYYDHRRTKPTKELELAWVKLREEVKEKNPNIIIALGGEALRALTGKRSIDAYRGTLLPGINCPKVLPTYHPAYVLRQYHHRAIVEMDLRKAIRHSKSPKLEVPAKNFITDPSFITVMDTLQFIKANKKTIAFDIETIGSHVRCLGFAWSKELAICIPFASAKSRSKPGSSIISLGSSNFTSHWTEKQEQEIINLLGQIFEDPSIRKVAQNFPFDSTILARDFGFKIYGLQMDTLVAFHCLYSELPKSLDFLNSIYTDNPHYSHDHNSSSDLSNWKYNCWDVVATFESFRGITEELIEAEQLEFYENHAQPVMMSLTRVANRGINVDLKLRSNLVGETELAIEKSKEEISELAGKPLNPASSKQMQEYFYNELKIPPVVNRSTGRKTVDEKAMVKLKGRTKNPVTHKLLDVCLSYREHTKLLSTFLTSKLTDDGKMVTSYHATGTVTGRISSSKTIFGLGGNLQQIPKSPIRKMFKAAPNHVFIKADLSQAEARCVAWVAPIPQLIERFTNEEDFDIHRWAGSLIYGRDPAEITPAQRQLSKVGVHGGNYGLGPRTAATTFGISYQNAKMVIGRYREAIPEVGEWWESIKLELHKSRILTTPMGRRRLFFNRLDESLYRSAYSFIPQAMVADIINRAIFLSEAVLEEDEAYPIMQVHDEICFYCPEGNLDRALKKIRNLMEYPVKMNTTEIPLKIPADISVGPNWYDQEIVG